MGSYDHWKATNPQDAEPGPVPATEHERAITEFDAYLQQPIRTHHEFPPIPDRRFDWCAYRDAERFTGWGRTEAEAIADLELIEEGEQP